MEDSSLPGDPDHGGLSGEHSVSSEVEALGKDEAAGAKTTSPSSHHPWCWYTTRAQPKASRSIPAR